MATWDWDVKTGEVVVNRRWPDMGVVGSNDLSWSADHWISIVHPDDWPRVEQRLSTTLKAVQPSSNRNIGSEQGLTAGSGFSHAERSSTGTSTAGRCEWLEPRSTSLAENSSTTSELSRGRGNDSELEPRAPTHVDGRRTARHAELC